MCVRRARGGKGRRACGTAGVGGGVDDACARTHACLRGSQATVTDNSQT